MAERADNSAKDERAAAQPGVTIPRVALVTGTLASPGLQKVACELEQAKLAHATVVTLPIQVAALLTTAWLVRKLKLPEDGPFDRVILPGDCRGDLSELSQKLGVPVERGPRDMRDLPAYFGRQMKPIVLPEKPRLQIIAEINHAATMGIDAILEQARELVKQGADVIDLGCDPQAERPPWEGLGDVVRQLVREGITVSVDSFQPEEVAAACEAGASLVLSVNTSNAHLAKEWHGAQVVVLPDDPHTLDGLDESIRILQRDGVSYIIDPVLEPVGFGFARSLGRYLQVREKYPDAPMMMGVGNLSEMTEVDSAGVNMLLAAFCAELKIDYVLTTQVINWARTSVKELDIARRMVQYAIENNRVPKHVDGRLVSLRDAKLHRFSDEELQALAASMRDANVRIFAQDGVIHAMNRDFHVQGHDPFELFDQMKITHPSHAFYLGYEMAKAVTANTLGKHYTQDEALNWGVHTQPERSHHERRKLHVKSRVASQDSQEAADE